MYKILYSLVILFLLVKPVAAQVDVAAEINRIITQLEMFYEAGECEAATKLISGTYYSDNDQEAHVGRSVIIITGSVWENQKTNPKNCSLPKDMRASALVESYSILLNVKNLQRLGIGNLPIGPMADISEQLKSIFGDDWLRLVARTGFPPFPLEAAFQNLLCDKHDLDNQDTLLESISKDANDDLCESLYYHSSMRESLCWLKKGEMSMSYEACYWLNFVEQNKDEFTYHSRALVMGQIDELLFSSPKKFNTKYMELLRSSISVSNLENGYTIQRELIKFKADFVASYCKTYLSADDQVKIKHDAANNPPITFEELLTHIPAR